MLLGNDNIIIIICTYLNHNEVCVTSKSHVELRRIINGSKILCKNFYQRFMLMKNNNIINNKKRTFHNVPKLCNKSILQIIIKNVSKKILNNLFLTFMKVYRLENKFVCYCDTLKDAMYSDVEYDDLIWYINTLCRNKKFEKILFFMYLYQKFYNLIQAYKSILSTKDIFTLFKNGYITDETNLQCMVRNEFCQLCHDNNYNKLYFCLMSFGDCNAYDLFNIHAVKIVPRCLNELEKKYFKPITVGNNDNTRITIDNLVSQNQFKANFLKYYHYRTWRNYLRNFSFGDSDVFAITGDCVIRCLFNLGLENNDNKTIDFQMLGYMSDDAFKQEIYDIMFGIMDVVDNDIIFNHNKKESKIILPIKNEQLTFVFHNSSKLKSRYDNSTEDQMVNVLNNFDLSSRQVYFELNRISFGESSVQCTKAFIEFCNTGYYYSYRLCPNANLISYKHYENINKMIEKGFTKMLIPKKFKENYLMSQLKDNEPNIITTNDINVDYYNLKHAFLMELCNNVLT